MSELTTDEQGRLAALYALQVLDTPPEPAFDGIAEAAALACDLPIALITMIDTDRTWCKAKYGLDDTSQSLRNESICHYAIEHDGLFEISDTTADPRFADNFSITEELNIRVYAGMPLRLSNGHQVGTLCVLGHDPGRLNSTQQILLGHLATAVVQLLELHQATRDLATSQSRYRALCEASPLGVFSTDADGACNYTNDRWQAIFNLTNNEAAGKGWARNLHPDDRAAFDRKRQKTAELRLDFDTQFRIVGRDGTSKHVRAICRPIITPSGEVSGHVGSVEDVTNHVLLIKELGDQHELLHVALHSIGDAVITSDADGCVTWLNPTAEHMTGWVCKNALGRPLAQVFRVINESTRLDVKNPMEHCLSTDHQEGLASHSLLISRQDNEFGVEASASPIRSALGEQLGGVLVFHDVTEQRRLSGEMNHRATHDSLTGLVNRAEFENRLQNTLNHACEQQSQNALMFIDLDQFKLINDACGHAAGDQLLSQMAQLLQRTVRDGDTVARLGGDEFGVILENCTSEQAQQVAQKICDFAGDFRFIHGIQRFRVGTSIGLVPLDQRWKSTGALLQAADTSCYAAKEAGRNRVHAWFETDKIMQGRHVDMRWTTRLEKALDDNGFVLLAQRIDSLRDPAEAGLHAEVLIRLRDADGSLIAPGAFLPAAERFSLATRIDHWVLRQAIDQLKRLSDMTCVDTLCINLSGQSVSDRVFQRDAIDFLTESGADVCRRICLEITETAAVTHVVDTMVFIQQVRTLGVRIALDDFGAGASSFGYLKTMTVDVLKIDGQFITDLIDDPLDDAAVRCFVDIAHVMGLKTVAEFVNSPQILAHVRAIGIDYAQGYHLHEPEALARTCSTRPHSTLS